MVARFLRSLFPSQPERISGLPPSANGASSFHLLWQVPPRPLREVRADFEVVDPPTVDRLYFWALQVNFIDTVHSAGPAGAHFGLQHHPAYPGSGAVNWGGYHSGGGELTGTESALPSTLDNVNTRDYSWSPGRTYRFRVGPGSGPGRWQGSVIDLHTGQATVVRELLVEADALISPMVWSEVFARCDDPPVTVRWANFEADPADGAGTIRAKTVRLNYQTHGGGGCANTNTFIDASGSGFVQRTATERLNPTGTLLALR